MSTRPAVRNLSVLMDNSRLDLLRDQEVDLRHGGVVMNKTCGETETRQKVKLC